MDSGANSRLHPSYASQAQGEPRVGWVERSATHHHTDGFRRQEAPPPILRELRIGGAMQSFA